MTRAAGSIYLGTSGYAYDHFRGLLYPKGLAASKWLPRYAEVFCTLEVNATFYRLQSRETFERWCKATPKGFRFACKGSRYLTHMKRLLDVEQGLDRFFDPLVGLSGKVGPVLWQLPPQMKPDLERLDHFLGELPKRLAPRARTKLRYVVEFRSVEWYDPAVCDVLDRHGVAFCEHDLVDRSPPRQTGGFRYLRFHGKTGKYSGRYGRATLRRHAEDLASSRARGEDAWVFFNNDTHGHALYDAVDLGELLGLDVPLQLPSP